MKKHATEDGKVRSQAFCRPDAKLTKAANSKPMKMWAQDFKEDLNKLKATDAVN